VIGLHRFALFTSVSTWVLIWAGGLVTSTGSGLAVPDWPLSYGMLMPPLVGGILYEHGHRMVAAFVGLLTLALAAWLWRAEPRRWLRWLGVSALAMVITQGVLGGITVLYLLPTPVSVSHATLAQTFFCLTVLIAFATSGEWREARSHPDPSRPSLRSVAAIATLAVYLQLILGAAMRHTGAGLAIPDFPLAFGRLVPPLESGPVALHFTHRLGALVVLCAIVWLIARIARAHPQDSRFTRPAGAMGVLLVVQILLGGSIVWSQKAVLPSTAHVATGALLLATVWFVTLRAHRHLTASALAPAGLPVSGHPDALSR
jgi:cytochrome c oxidase assembly protein subunit 15